MALRFIKLWVFLFHINNTICILAQSSISTRDTWTREKIEFRISLPAHSRDICIFKIKSFAYKFARATCIKYRRNKIIRFCFHTIIFSLWNNTKIDRFRCMKIHKTFNYEYSELTLASQLDSVNTWLCVISWKKIYARIHLAT